MEWYYTLNDQQQGPVNQEQLGGLLQSGTIQAETLVWKDGMADWQPLSIACSELLGGGAVAAAAATAADKDLNVQAMREGVYGTIEGAQLEYAGFWIRFAAKFLDGIILNIAMIPVQIIFGAVGAASPEAAVGMMGIFFLLSLAIPLIYNGFMVGKYGATLGKMACGLKVVRPDGSPVSMGVGFGRYLSEIVSSLILCIGYIMAAFDDEKRALHDRMVSSRVIKKR